MTDHKRRPMRVEICTRQVFHYLLTGGRRGKKQNKMKRVAQTENESKKYGTLKSVKGVEQQGEG